MKFEDNFFVRFKFSKEQIEKNFANAFKDLDIAKKVDIPDVKFHYAYKALIKGGIALLSHQQVKIKSILGHQAKIIEKMAQILDDDSIETLGNISLT